MARVREERAVRSASGLPVVSGLNPIPHEAWMPPASGRARPNAETSFGTPVTIPALGHNFANVSVTGPTDADYTPPSINPLTIPVIPDHERIR